MFATKIPADRPIELLPRAGTLCMACVTEPPNLSPSEGTAP